MVRITPGSVLPEVVWTIGHSTRSWEEFLALLREQAIEQIVDVRRFTGSRKHPQFGHDQLVAELSAAGLSYVPISGLGGRRRPSADSVNTVWRNPSFRAYADHMQTAEYREGLEQLLAVAARRRTAIMCAEAVWWRCHRSMIADDLTVMGVRVLHILARGNIVQHSLTSPASIKDGALFYGPGSHAAEQPEQ